MRSLAATLLVCLIAVPGLAGPKDAKPARRAAATQAKRAKSIANVLATRRVSIDFEKASLDRLVRYVRAASGLNIVVLKSRIERDGGDPEGMEISLKVKNVPVGDALRLALEPHDLGLKLKGNVLLVTSKRDARGKPVLRIYSVAHLLVPIRDFPAPDMNIYPSGYEPPEPPEAEVVQTYESSEELAELVRNFTGQGTWEDEGVNVTVFRKHLFIRTYPMVHKEIAGLLARLPR